MKTQTIANPYIMRMVANADTLISVQRERKKAIQECEEIRKEGLATFPEGDAQTKAAINLFEAEKQIKLKKIDDEITQLKTLSDSDATEYVKELGKIVDEYNSAVDEWGQMRADNLPSDVELLKSATIITKSDLDTLVNRHWNNYTMQRMIQSVAKDKGIIMTHAPTPEQKKMAMSEIENFLKGVQADSYAGRMFEQYLSDPNQAGKGFNNFFAKYDGVIGDGAELKGMSGSDTSTSDSSTTSA
jgi:hypothetical protein